MKRYALPLGILGVILILIILVVFSSNDSGGPNYTGGNTQEPAISDEWVRGNKDSSVVLIEYSDFQCPACKLYEGLLFQVQEQYGDRVAFIYRHFPLTQIHANADLAARASEAAGLQDKFWEMQDLLFTGQDQWSKLINANSVFKGYAQELGLDLTKFQKDITSEAVRQQVVDDYARGLKVGVAGTPTFILNGVKLPRNPGSYEEFAALLDQIVQK